MIVRRRRGLLRGLARRLVGVAWEAPQTALGLAALGLAAATGQVRALRWARGRVFVESRRPVGVSLGHVVFYTAVDGPFVPVGAENVDHEYGHAVQSRRLGPLYLPVVGVASVARVAFAVAHRAALGRRWAGYYAGFPESGADRLGGVDARRRPPP